MRTFPAPNTPTSLQTTFAADAHLAEGQFLLEEHTLNIAKSPHFVRTLCSQFSDISADERTETGSLDTDTATNISDTLCVSLPGYSQQNAQGI
jgi:hypothetical protein